MNALDLLTRLYDATDAAARETAALREFEATVRASLQPGRMRGISGADDVAKLQYQVIGEVAIALKALDAARGGESQ